MALMLIEHEQHPDIADVIGLYELETELNKIIQNTLKTDSFNVIDDYLTKIDGVKTYMSQENKVQIVKSREDDWKKIAQCFYIKLLDIFSQMHISIQDQLPEEAEVEAIIDDMIRPALAEHAGNIQITYLNNGVLGLKLLGTCQGCAFSLVTLTSHISKILGIYFPAVLFLHIQQDLFELQ